jgi:hypothetical protein
LAKPKLPRSSTDVRLMKDPTIRTVRAEVVRIADEMDRAVRHSYDVRDAMPTDLVDIWQRQLRELMGR